MIVVAVIIGFLQIFKILEYFAVYDKGNDFPDLESRNKLLEYLFQ